MGKTVYDIVHLRYRLHKRLRPAEEALAKAIVRSGKLRLDADNESNFVRVLVPAERVNITFTQRELNDPELFPHSKGRLLELIAKRHAPAEAERLTLEYLTRARQDLQKRSPVAAQTETMMARALVSCNAYPVIQLLHLEGAEIFISFGHSVGDVMDVARWEEMGANSGLQAVGGGENAVYVSCGGHPFLSPNEYRHSGDGPPALARFLIIAAQETGHNGDMIRGEGGRWVGRHSAVGWQSAPSEKAGKGRLADIARTEAAYLLCQRLGMNRISRWEASLKFYRDKRLFHLRRLIAWLGCKLGWQVMKLRLYMKGAYALSKLQRHPYPCTLLRSFFPDMLFNLSPEADVYRRKDPLEEEAIACIEAVARVPQQVIKWGHAAVRFVTPRLYSLYYSQIVPACQKSSDRLLSVG